MTKDLEKNYLENHGSKCPYCDAKDISAGHIEAEGLEAFSIVKCRVCKMKWQDLYKLVGIEDNGEGGV